jgi:recombination DNA repair RAD52 pathway protein
VIKAGLHEQATTNNGGTGMAAPVEGPNGQMVKALDVSQLPKRKATAEDLQRFEEATRTPQEKQQVSAKALKKTIENKVQTVFRRNGEEIAHVETDSAVMVRNSLSELMPMINEIKDDPSLSTQQKADKLSQKMSEALREKFGSSVEIQHYSEGNEITQGELRAQRGGHDSVQEYLLANHGQLVMDTNVFADVFSEE